MKNWAVAFAIVGIMAAIWAPLAVSAYQEEKTKQVAMEHGYIQVNGQWVKPEEKKQQSASGGTADTTDSNGSTYWKRYVSKV